MPAYPTMISMINTARRFIRRCQDRGIQIMAPAIFETDYIDMNHADRTIRIKPDGSISIATKV